MATKFELPTFNFVSIDSDILTKEVFEQLDEKYSRLGYTFKGKENKPLREALRGAFNGEVALEKFRPYEKNSQAKVLEAANTTEFHNKYSSKIGEKAAIPTSLEWSAILLAAEAMVINDYKHSEDAKKLLNDDKEGMLLGRTEITNTALYYQKRKNTPDYLFNNTWTYEKLEDFPSQEGTLKKAIPELGLPKGADVFLSLPSKNDDRLRSVFRGNWDVPRRERRFGTYAYWEPLESYSHLASRVIIRKYTERI